MKSEKWKTTFQTKYEHYKYKIMSFKLINTSATCQQMINDALRDLLNIIVITYLDDILVYSENSAKHEKHVKQILKHLTKYNLCFKSEKCEWFKKEIKFLEFMIKRNSI